MRILLCLAPLFLAAAGLAQDSLPTRPGDIATPPLEPFHPPQPQTLLLESGSSLLLIEDHELPLVDGQLLFRCGTIQDPTDKAGLARMLVDVLREGGSQGASGAQLDEWLDSHAASISIAVKDDQLAINFSCLTEDTDAVLSRIAALLLDPAYPTEELEKSRARMLTEIERRDDDTSALADRVLLQVIYGPDSAYSRVESRESLAAVTREDLLAYHRAHLGADRLMIGVTGDTDMDALQSACTTHFDSLPVVGPAPEVPAPSFVQPQHTKVYIYDRPGIPQSELRISSAGTRRMHSSYSALNLWSYVIGIGGMTNRMMVKVRTELGLAYSVGAYYRPEWERSGRLQAYCSTRNDGLADAAEAMIGVLQGGLTEIPNEELEATRARTLNAEVFHVDTPDKVLARAMALAFHGYPADFYEQHELRLRDLTAEELISTASRQLDTGRLVVLAVGPYDEIAESMARIGEVERVELGSKAGKRTETVDVGPLLETMFGAIGGRERWAEARWIDYESTIVADGTTVTVHMQRDLEAPRMHASNTFDGVVQTIIVNENGAWVLAGGAVSELPPDLHKKLLNRANHDLFALLHQIAGGLSVAANADGDLVILDGEALGTRIELDVAGRPTRLIAATGTTPLSYRFEGWTEGDALDAPARIVKEQDEMTRVIVRVATPESMDEALFVPPTGG